MAEQITEVKANNPIAYPKMDSQEAALHKKAKRSFMIYVAVLIISIIMLIGGIVGYVYKQTAVMGLPIFIGMFGIVFPTFNRFFG